MTTYYFAWVDSTETAFSAEHARNDEDVYTFRVDHSEGDFPVLSIRIRNPRVGLLTPSRKVWAWLSCSGLDTGGPEPLFFGRLVGVPTQLDKTIFEIVFSARPTDLVEQKQVLAAVLNVTPYYDPVWLSPERRDDPDTALEARSALWHFDRITHQVSVSDIIDGEDGTVLITGDLGVADTLGITLGDQPLRSVKIEADVFWSQTAHGTVDITDSLTAAFDVAGTDIASCVSSYTGQGLIRDWPEVADDIGGGWSVATAGLTRLDGVIAEPKYAKVSCRYRIQPSADETDTTPEEDVIAYIRLWQVKPLFEVKYETQRQRRESISFTLNADVQPLYRDSEDDESELITFSSGEVGELVDVVGTDAERPIGDLRRRQYFPTERGKRSIEYLIAVARASLLSRARAVQVSEAIPFDFATTLSCRKNATIQHPDLPNGTATGKITSYAFGVSGDGSSFGLVTIGCTIGRGNVVSENEGEPTYVEDDYMEDDIQRRAGQQIAPIPEEVYYEPPTTGPSDDGLDFFNMTEDAVVEVLTVTNGQTAQAALLRQQFIDVPACVAALNAIPTTVRLVLKPVTGGPFEQHHYITVSDLMVPKTIDLEVG